MASLSNSEPVKERRIAILVAVIAVVASTLGALAGGYASYLGNKNLESERGMKAAQGAARVLQAQLVSVDVRLRAMLDRDRLYGIDDAYDVGLPQEDQQLIAANADGSDWARVSAAMAAIQLYATTDDQAQRRANAHLVVPLDPRLRAYIRSTERAVQQGVDGLKEVAD